MHVMQGCHFNLNRLIVKLIWLNTAFVKSLYRYWQFVHVSSNHICCLREVSLYCQKNWTFVNVSFANRSSSCVSGVELVLLDIPCNLPSGLIQHAIQLEYIDGRLFCCWLRLSWREEMASDCCKVTGRSYCSQLPPVVLFLSSTPVAADRPG